MRWLAERARAARQARRQGDGGFTLVELLAAMGIFGIVLTLVVSVIAVLSASTYRSLNVSQQTNTAQVSVARAEQFLTGVVPPMVAATSSFPSSTATTAALSGTTPCWGTTQPASSTQTTSTIPTDGQTLTAPSRTSITVAHDYDMVWCGYAPNSSIPNVYEGSLSGCSGTYGNCTFTITAYGSSCVPGVASPAANGSSSGCSAGAAAVTIPHVWCDAYCQGSSGVTTNPAGAGVHVACIDVAGNTSATCTNNTPPLFSYFASGNGRYTTTVNHATLTLGSNTVTFSSSGSPGLTAGMAITGAGIPSSATVVSVSGSAGSYSLTMTEPGNGGATAGGPSNLTFAGTNYQNSLNFTAANETSSGCTSAGKQLFLDLVQNTSGSCADPATFLPGIQDVTLNLTILSNNGTPGGSNSTGPASTSSATIDNQILLANQLQANSSCGSTTFEYPPDLTSFFPLDSTQNPLTDLGQTSNGTSQTDVQMQYTTSGSPLTLSTGTAANPTLSASGPLACNATSTPGTAFNGSNQYAIDDYWDTPTPATACSQSIPCLWGTSSATGLTVEAEIQVPAGTAASTRERIISDGDANGTTAATAQGIELALKPAASGTPSCGETGGNTNGFQPGGIVFSADGGSWYQCLPTGLAAGTWYFVAATLTWSGSTATATVYINGSAGTQVVGTVPLTGLSSYIPSNGAGCPLLIGTAANSTGLTAGCPANGVPANFFDGDIADVATYSTPLTAVQIQTQYNELSQ